VAIGAKLDVVAGADDGVDLGARPGWRWDVALSFAGARRDYVGQVAEVLQARGAGPAEDPRARAASLLAWNPSGPGAGQGPPVGASDGHDPATSQGG
jgi:hypothetical protein